MRKAALIVIAVAVAVMFAIPAFAAESTSCGSCAKPCSTCAKPCVTPCAKPCACSTPCMALPKVKVNWCWPSMKIEPCPCPAPCAKPCPQYTRDVLGNKVPAATADAGNALNDKATGYETTLNAASK